MTIENAKMIMLNEQPHCGEKLTLTESERYEAYNTAIRSLEAWQKVREEIEIQKKGFPPSADYYKAINRSLDIIDKHLKEVDV